VVGRVDLSIGAVASFAGILYALLSQSGMPLFAAFLLTLCASALLVANGFW
jgi:ribose/xylose/arabinose/galactoside ABC-type transport system permease subunit